MSRCYPYPPSGYVKNGGAGIDWIKLKREGEKVKTETKKEKKREKERRKAHKGKEKPTDIGDGKKRKLNYKKYDQLEQSRAESCDGYFQKQIEAGAEQLEKSDLTEEHEQPICYPNVCSDRSQISNKRKRDTSPTSGFCGHGTIIRIRLPSKKDRDHEKLCSTSGRVDFHARQKNDSVDVPSQEQFSSTNAKENILDEELTTKPKKELPCPVPGRTETSYKNEIQWTESVYKALIENWVPPPPQDQENVFSDEGWLFKTKQEDRHRSKRFEAGNDVISCRSPTLWPHVYYLPEADVYALPYTIPF